MAVEFDHTLPFFASTADRDARYAAWVAEGGSLREGMYCHVKGVGLQVYEAQAWRTARH